MSNKDLLKQAIAEAKTVREAAIANAKEALEESLTPHLKEMLAQKLQEMENDEMEEEVMDEAAERLNGTETQDGTTTGDHGNVVKEEEAEEAEEESEEEVEEDEDIKIEDMSVEELKDLIRDIVAQETGEEEAEEDNLEADDMTGMEDGEEEIDINELLAEIESMEEQETMDESIDVIAQLIDMFPFLNNNTAQMLLGAFGAAGLTGFSAIAAKVHEMALKGNFGEKAKAFAEKLQQSGKAAFNVTQQKEGAEKDMEEGHSYDLKPGAESGDTLGANDGYTKAGAKGKNPANEKEFVKFVKEEELEEALSTVSELRAQLQEVNLLNAKLLYVNRVFKANNLTESQKVNVVAAFDKAETVKEVKLVFETVSKNVVAKQSSKPAIKEHTSFASKPAGSTQKQVINEVSEAVNRMQILAGIKERQF